MKNTKVFLRVTVASMLVMFSTACRGTDTESEVTSQTSEIVTSLTEESVISSEPEDSSLSEPDMTSDPADISDSEKEPGEDASLEERTLDVCKDMGLEYVKYDQGDMHSYDYTTDSQSIYVMVFSATEAAAERFQMIMDYGGWYEQDGVEREIHDSKENYRLEAVYVTIETDNPELFVEVYMDNCVYSLEGFGTDGVEKIEAFCQKMGFCLDEG